MTASLSTGDQALPGRQNRSLTRPGSEAPSDARAEVRHVLPGRLPAFYRIVGSLQQVCLALYAAETGTWEWDVENNTITWSMGVDKMFGLQPQRGNASCAELADQLLPEDLAKLRVLLGEMLKEEAGGKRFEFRFRIRRADGEVRWLEAVGSVGRSATLCVLGTIRDVTDRERTSSETHSHSCHAQRLESIGSVASGIAHELKNILTPIILHTQLLQEDFGPEHPAQSGLREVIKGCARAGDLIRQILTLSRREEMRRAPADLQEVVADAVKLLKATIPESVSVGMRSLGTLPPVLADATQIQQIVLNLGINAWHAFESGEGTIDITLEEVAQGAGIKTLAPELAPGRYVRLSVSDNGKGMDEATLARIFEPFFTTKTNGQGTGLGLPIVESIVKSHEGALTVESKPGQGATFRIYFPARSGNCPAAASQQTQGG